MTGHTQLQADEIARKIGTLHGEYYGHEPGLVDVHIGPNVVIVVMEETFTPAEKTLIERGSAQEVQQIRRRFQQVKGNQFCSVVEQATGRTVRTFLSDTDLEQRLAVEVFLLGSPREAMHAVA
jgi:uncharacterized protein YbcI